jgi:hypothetical protein
MANIPSIVIRAVNTRTLLVYVLYLRATSSLFDVDWIQLLESQGASSAVSFMQEYWISNDESPEKFWEVRSVYICHVS